MGGGSTETTSNCCFQIPSAYLGSSSIPWPRSEKLHFMKISLSCRTQIILTFSSFPYLNRANSPQQVMWAFGVTL